MGGVLVNTRPYFKRNSKPTKRATFCSSELFCVIREHSPFEYKIIFPEVLFETWKMIVAIWSHIKVRAWNSPPKYEKPLYKITKEKKTKTCWNFFKCSLQMLLTLYKSRLNSINLFLFSALKFAVCWKIYRPPSQLPEKKSPGALYWTHFDVWMPGLDNFITDIKETGGNRYVVPLEKATISWIAKKSNKTVLLLYKKPTQQDHS